MRTLATIALSIFLSLPAGAAVVHDEGVDGDLSTDPAIPTPLSFALGGNTVIGTCGNVGSPTDIRDYLTFTIPAGQVLSHLNLLAFAPDNLAFASFNAGTSSFVPSAATDLLFLAGIHPNGGDVGSDLMPLFVNRAETQNSLAVPQLGAGSYCFLIQQTSPLTTSYTLEFVLDTSVPTQAMTWGTIKRLYR